MEARSCSVDGRKGNLMLSRDEEVFVQDEEWRRGGREAPAKNASTTRSHVIRELLLPS
jgi:hypothetical protein